MITDILAWTPGLFELLVILILFGVPVLLVVWFVKSVLRNKKENIRLRLELGKLADQLEQIKKQAESGKKD